MSSIWIPGWLYNWLPVLSIVASIMVLYCNPWMYILMPMLLGYGLYTLYIRHLS